ncbi:protein AF1q isoform X1 [Mastomys coucha]|uniref:protein AF1q isoform X1 n=1 Tax=Mastomys coucha TaxID=35658 RepID=UPI00126288A3|nr:protein AF1q isoform X1 [Mastomys coucha]
MVSPLHSTWFQLQAAARGPRGLLLVANQPVLTLRCGSFGERVEILETILSFPQKPSDELPSLSLRLLSPNTDLPPKIRGSQLLLTERIVHEDHQGSVTAETKKEGGPKDSSSVPQPPRPRMGTSMNCTGSVTLPRGCLNLA